MNQARYDWMRKKATSVFELTKGFTPEQRKYFGNAMNTMEEMAGFVLELTNDTPRTPAGAVWVKGEYGRFYDQVKGGQRGVCYVDYKLCDGNPARRDVAAVNPNTMNIGVRGLQYGDITFQEEIKPERKRFIQMCESCNVEWLDERMKKRYSKKTVKK